MEWHGNDVLGFEDMTFGSFAAVAHVPSAGYRWSEVVEPRAVPSIEDAIAILKALHPNSTSHGVQFKEEGSNEQDIVGFPSNERHLPDGGPWLVENDPIAGAAWGRRRAPLKKGDVGKLVRWFAMLKRAEDYLNFANKYGCLRHPEQFESLAYWETHTRRVRAMRTIAQWIFQRDESKLAWVVRWSKETRSPTIWPGAAVDYGEAQDEQRRYEPIPEGASWETRSVRNGRLDFPIDLPWFWKLGRHHIVQPDILYDAKDRTRWRFGDVIEPARFYLFEELNRAVKGHVTTRLMPFASGELHRVYVVPDCLEATIYLQLQLMFARGHVDENWKLCKAQECINFFKPNRNQRYCSSKCEKWGRSQSQKRYRQK
jgi:hypothetical protein